MISNKNVVFDIVGSFVSYDHLFEAIEAHFGDRLKVAGIQAKLLGSCWLETAEPEYTYLSLPGRYATFKVFESYRMLMYAGIAEPCKFATSEDVAYLVDEQRKLSLRPGAAECVWYFTAGDIKRVGGYFKLAGIDMPPENCRHATQRS